MESKGTIVEEIERLAADASVLYPGRRILIERPVTNTASGGRLLIHSNGNPILSVGYELSPGHLVIRAYSGRVQPSEWMDPADSGKYRCFEITNGSEAEAEEKRVLDYCRHCLASFN